MKCERCGKTMITTRLSGPGVLTDEVLICPDADCYKKHQAKEAKKKPTICPMCHTVERLSPDVEKGSIVYVGDLCYKCKKDAEPKKRPTASASMNNNSGEWEAWCHGKVIAQDKYLSALTAKCLNLGCDVDVLE